MNQPRATDHLDKLFVQIGKFTVAWAMVEHSLNHNIFWLYASYFAVRVDRHPPLQFDRKLRLFRKVHRLNVSKLNHERPDFLQAVLSDAEDIGNRLEVLKQKRTFLIHGVPDLDGNHEIKFSLREFTGVKPGMKSIERHMYLTLSEIEAARKEALSLVGLLLSHLQHLAVALGTVETLDLAHQSLRELVDEFGRRLPSRNLRLDQAD